jgi:hypothetical protein
VPRMLTSLPCRPTKLCATVAGQHPTGSPCQMFVDARKPHRIPRRYAGFEHLTASAGTDMDKSKRSSTRSLKDPLHGYHTGRTGPVSAAT